MTPFGDYKATVTPEGVILIDTDEFIKVNWPLLCEISGFAYPPKLRIVPEQGRGSLNTFLGMCAKSGGRHPEIWLDPPGLEKDAYEIAKEGGNVLASLWAISSTMLRVILTTQEIIPRDQYIGARAARRGGFLKSTTATIHRQLGGPKPNTPVYGANFDAWVVFYAIYGYIQIVGIEETVDEDEIRKIVRAEKDDIKPNFFP